MRCLVWLGIFEKHGKRYHWKEFLAVYLAMLLLVFIGIQLLNRPYIPEVESPNRVLLQLNPDSLLRLQSETEGWQELNWDGLDNAGGYLYTWVGPETDVEELVLFDADLQHSPEEIARFVQALDEGSDLVKHLFADLFLGYFFEQFFDHSKPLWEPGFLFAG